MTVTDLKQWVYCRRIPYYRFVMPVRVRGTHSMERGRRAQAELERLEIRRKLRRYGLEEGRREFGIFLRSERLRLTGKLDLAVVTADGVWRPVDIKWADGGPAEGHRVQVAAYGMMLEEREGKAVEKGFVVTLPSGEVHEVLMDAGLRSQVEGALEGIRRMVRLQEMPPPAEARAKCVHCEYRNFCGDVA